MCCSVSQCVAVCSVLQCVVCCSVTSENMNVLQCVAVCCSATSENMNEALEEGWCSVL